MIHSVYLSGNYISVCGRREEFRNKRYLCLRLPVLLINFLSYWKLVLSLPVFIVWIALQSGVESALPSRCIWWRRNSRNNMFWQIRVFFLHNCWACLLIARMWKYCARSKPLCHIVKTAVFRFTLTYNALYKDFYFENKSFLVRLFAS